MARTLDVEVDLRKYEDEVVEYVKAIFRPEDVFPEDELAEWAKDHGWIKDSD